MSKNSNDVLLKGPGRRTTGKQPSHSVKPTKGHKSSEAAKRHQPAMHEPNFKFMKTSTASKSQLSFVPPLPKSR